ncbi:MULTISPECIES: major capsid protein [Halomonadaceae]|uniref:major capsid protein n=1 Tax=Halomonadaceae TaxID=28256 RepID=UPI0015975DFF|nr:MULTISPECIES: major capsid protein [Halomonas]QJQ96263.1 methyltransferase [Halomonas sp. PA5]
MRLIKQAKKAIVVAPAAFLASGAVMAQEVDTAGLVSTIEGAMGPVGAVGLAVLGVLAAIMVFSLIRRVMR